jgi:cytidylate kinase
VAARLGLGYLDTGAMYRAATFAVLRRGIAPGDLDAVAEVAADLELELDDRMVRVDGVDATTAIRGRDVTEAVSAVAANSRVRAVMVARQRAWVADRGGGVVEGRDIGSVVFPDAALKLYVTASPRIRAERRVAELGGDLHEIESAIIERDRRDSTRADSPLLEADGALVVDTSDLTVAEVVDRIVAMLPGGGSVATA